MLVVSLCPLRVASLPWRPSSGGFALTVICKATFDLRPGELRLAEQQEDPNEDDNFWDDDPKRSLYSPSDLAPFKPRADVLLVGQAYALGQVPVRTLFARLSVAGVDKTIEVWGERSFGPDGGLREGPPFTSMPLRYERAAGGAENPVGVRPGGLLPNLQVPGAAPGRRADSMAAIGFGPIASRWPARHAKLGRHAASFAPRRWEDQPMPEDLDPSFFNVAPTDQQPERIEPGARLVLENLSPAHARLRAELPRLRPRAFVDRGAALEELSLSCDTLWIDTDRALCTLTWRGQLGLAGPHDEGRVLVLLDRPSQPLTWQQIQQQCAAPAAGARQAAIPVVDSAFMDDDDMDRSTGTRQYHMPTLDPGVAASRGALPFVQTPGEAPPAPRAAPGGPPPWLAAQARPPAPSLSDETVTPGALHVDPKWARHDSPPPPAPPAPMRAAPQVPVIPAAPVRPRSDPPPALVGPSLLAISNQAVPAPVVEVAAPSPARPSPSARIASAEIVDLLWFDATTPDLARLNLPWQELIAKIQPIPPEIAHDDDPPEEAQEVKDRRDVFGVLTDAAPTSLDELDAAVEAATSPRGAFKPPLLLVAGELELTFDDLSTLKAMLSAVAPFVAGPDKKLKDAFEAANEALKSPWLTSGRAVENLTTRLRDTFAQGSWGLPPGFLDQQVERILVEQRQPQKRVVLGQTWIRALLAPGVPTYLPEALAGKLPLYARFSARVIVEVHLQQEQYESHPYALRALALARVTQAKAARGQGRRGA